MPTYAGTEKETGGYICGKLKKVKTNEDMLKLADSEQLRKALKRMCWKTTMYLSPLLREAQEKRIDEWLGEEAGPEWRE